MIRIAIKPEDFYDLRYLSDLKDHNPKSLKGCLANSLPRIKIVDEKRRGGSLVIALIDSKSYKFHLNKFYLLKAKPDWSELLNVRKMVKSKRRPIDNFKHLANGEIEKNIEQSGIINLKMTNPPYKFDQGNYSVYIDLPNLYIQHAEDGNDQQNKIYVDKCRQDFHNLKLIPDSNLVSFPISYKQKELDLKKLRLFCIFKFDDGTLSPPVISEIISHISYKKKLSNKQDNSFIDEIPDNNRIIDTINERCEILRISHNFGNVDESNEMIIITNCQFPNEDDEQWIAKFIQADTGAFFDSVVTVYSTTLIINVPLYGNAQSISEPKQFGFCLLRRKENGDILETIERDSFTYTYKPVEEKCICQNTNDFYAKSAHNVRKRQKVLDSTILNDKTTPPTSGNYNVSNDGFLVNNQNQDNFNHAVSHHQPHFFGGGYTNTQFQFQDYLLQPNVSTGPVEDNQTNLIQVNLNQVDNQVTNYNNCNLSQVPAVSDNSQYHTNYPTHCPIELNYVAQPINPSNPQISVNSNNSSDLQSEEPLDDNVNIEDLLNTFDPSDLIDVSMTPLNHSNQPTENQVMNDN